MMMIVCCSVSPCDNAMLARSSEAYGLFDLVLCQLVISVVGSVQQRSALLQTAFRHLKPGGVLLLSASGASEDINSKYKALYDQDLAITGEYR